MGMAASQARLLSITARLTDNENLGQSLSFTKISLANQTEQLNADYNAALNKTKLTVLTGFNGSDEIYTDISYGLMTGYNNIAGGMQYCVTDPSGKVLVTEEYAEAFINANGDLNKFMEALNFTIADINVTEADKTLNDQGVDTNDATINAERKIHEAWDKYLTSVGIHYGDEEHSVDYGIHDGKNKYPVAEVEDANGNVEEIELNYLGTTPEQRELYDYAVALTSAYYDDTIALNKTNDPATPGLKSAAFSENVPEIQYIRNVFDMMSSAGFYSYTTDANKADDPHYMVISDIRTPDGNQVNRSPLEDSQCFEEYLKSGKLLLQTFSAKEGKFVSTSLSDDTCIQEVEDKRAIALVESQYETDMMKIENQDNKIDLQIKKLDTEHTALQTEYDSVKSVIDKNVEKSFNMFS